MEITLKYQSRTLVYAGILFVVALVTTIALIVVPDDNTGYLYSAFVSGFFAVIVLVIFLKEKKRAGQTIVISPEGIRTAQGELVKASDIDLCYLHFCDLFIRGGKYSSIDKSFSRLIIVFKDGRQKRLDIEDFGISIKDAETFHKKVNTINGLPLFKDPVIERF